MDTAFASAVEISALVRSGEASAREVTEAALRRIEALDPALNAFVAVDGERALADADKVQPGDAQPFAGVPIAVKGNVSVEGFPLTFGSRFVEGLRAAQDAFLVSRLREAGFVIVGTTNLPEFAILPTTEPRFGGPTRNPWELDRTPGGSSGGSAAAVAAGMVPLAHGNDGGGSLRIPAACCGLVGLKPSRGRISVGPAMGDSFLACHGVLTRTVADTAHALDVLNGYEVGDATWAPRPAEPYATALRRDPGRLRVAVTAANSLGVEPPADALDGVRRGAEILQGLGHEVEEVAPPFPPAEVLDAFINVFGPMIALGIEMLVRMKGREPEADEIEPLSRAVLERARNTPAVTYLSTLAELQALARRIVGFFADYDVLVTPALGARPLLIGECHGYGEDPMGDLARSGLFTPYTSLFNVTGQPAISVPVGLGADGLPVGIQIVGRPLAEDRLLQLARQLEYASPWAHLRPEDPRGDL
ncbi:amidase [Solirubrobacter sp. CPCC 204708]|uniref:Amidase n=1 Tax=Solirubrobacter deserti TaxID=2282478 RepID=A0ABT4RBI3_9ACTN|nr:amidase [Solirubrobacter deserti]MBE2317215.1 amidase [Solirubrobacter deserti]MDA0135892.1 amidase [Solirubrobacter deserti]